MSKNDLVQFRCPSCGVLLAKSNGTKLESYCRRCHEIKDGVSALLKASSTVLTAVPA